LKLLFLRKRTKRVEEEKNIDQYLSG